MIGSFLTRGLVLAFGYAYPAYECYKTVEKNRPEIEQLQFWCQYWILVAVLTIFERVGDAFISWVPMYSEAKLAFFIYLWYPKTKGTTYVYDSFFRPYLSKHESDIDRNLLELKTRAWDFAILYWQRVASYGQTRVFDILQYIAAQSTPNPRAAQPQQPGTQAAPTRQSSTPRVPVEPEEPPSPASSNSSSQEQVKVVEPTAPKTDAATSLPSALKVTPSPAATIQSVPGDRGIDRMETEATSRDEAVNPPAKPPPPKETLMEVIGHRTRARLRRARAISVDKDIDSASP
ncbi:hypothetical protein MLD38_002127 [Melastoma candidum]|uniref:Uncharacterized protein n=1 Tax=Melastoma candidum TaxID=119954 RepID=A0ACB9SFI6_9MYRT|nr:hypothetical protein MLD38_002127 [Melastoma candidum]